MSCLPVKIVMLVIEMCFCVKIVNKILLYKSYRNKVSVTKNENLGALK
jgi:hypothetical protein